MQDLISNKVDFVLIHHAISGGIAFLKSADQYGLNVPIVTSFGPAQPALYTSTPYNASKNTVVINCADPPTIAKTAQGKLALTMAISTATRRPSTRRATGRSAGRRRRRSSRR